MAQYFKADIEYKQFWDIGSNAVFGIRSFLEQFSRMIIRPYLLQEAISRAVQMILELGKLMVWDQVAEIVA